MKNDQNFIWGNELISTTNVKHPIYQFREPQAYHYMQDHLGSPIGMVNHKPIAHSMKTDVDEMFNGVVFKYNEFGVPEQESYFANPFGFTGYMLDSITNSFSHRLGNIIRS